MKPIPIYSETRGPIEAVPVTIIGPEDLGQREPLLYVQATLDATTAVNPPIPAGARQALVRVEAHGIRYCDDGQEPTPTYGMPIYAGEYLRYDAKMNKIRVIGMENGAILNISFYGAEEEVTDDA